MIAFIIAFLAIDNVNGHQREFSLTDESIMYTFAVKETIPTWLLVVCAVILPISFVLLWTLIIPPLGSYQRRRWRKGEMTWKEKLWDANLSLLGIGLALASTITITNSFKNLVGRPRPGMIWLDETNMQISLIVVNRYPELRIRRCSHCRMSRFALKQPSSRMDIARFQVDMRQVNLLYCSNL